MFSVHSTPAMCDPSQLPLKALLSTTHLMLWCFYVVHAVQVRRRRSRGNSEGVLFPTTGLHNLVSTQGLLMQQTVLMELQPLK
jgi:hypothetical protein